MSLFAKFSLINHYTRFQPFQAANPVHERIKVLSAKKSNSLSKSEEAKFKRDREVGVVLNRTTQQSYGTTVAVIGGLRKLVVHSPYD